MSEKKQRLITPVGTAKWASVHAPKEAFKDKSGREQGDPKYQIDLVFGPNDMEWKAWAGELMAEVKKLPQQIDKRTGAAIPHQVPVKREFDQDDKPTGNFYVTFKTGAKFKPGVFDKYGRVIPETTLIGNGSQARVNYTPSVYEGFGGGIALYLNAVQVMELVEYKPQAADAFGFKTETPPEGDAFPPMGDASEPPAAGVGNPPDDASNIPF